VCPKWSGTLPRLLGKGYILRDYKSVPEFSAYPEYSGRRHDRSQWKQLIDMHNANQSMPVHWHKKYCKIKSQKRTNYCWMFGTVACVENRLAHQGISGVDLCAFATAYRGKQGRNRGGYGVEACRYIDQFGIPDCKVYPNFSKDMSLWKRPEVIASSSANKIVSFNELGRNDFEGAVSALIDDVDPRPVTLALSWWRHLVCGLGVAYNGRDYGIIIANSHGTQYSAGGEKNGYGILWGRKAVPFESVAVGTVLARKE